MTGLTAKLVRHAPTRDALVQGARPLGALHPIGPLLDDWSHLRKWTSEPHFRDARDLSVKTPANFVACHQDLCGRRQTQKPMHVSGLRFSHL